MKYIGTTFFPILFLSYSELSPFSPFPIIPPFPFLNFSFHLSTDGLRIGFMRYSFPLHSFCERCFKVFFHEYFLSTLDPGVSLWYKTAFFLEIQGGLCKCPPTPCLWFLKTSTCFINSSDQFLSFSISAGTTLGVTLAIWFTHPSFLCFQRLYHLFSTQIVTLHSPHFIDYYASELLVRKSKSCIFSLNSTIFFL